MKKITLSFEVLAAIIAVTILQACAGTTTTTQCAKPTLTPPGYSGPVHRVTVTIRTATTGAYLRYTLDRSTPTGGTVRSRHENSSGKRASHVRYRAQDVKSHCVQSGMDHFVDRSRQLRLRVRTVTF